jgi:LPXTG-motif cell wall-anchored protein
MKKILSLVLALAMVLMVGAAFAQTEAYTGDDAGSATITIENAARGETYSVVKLFDATVGSEADGYPIAYTGTIPDTLTDLFEVDSATGAITAKVTEFTSAHTALLKTWAQSQTPKKSATSDGSVLEFTNLPYGYYVVLTSQGAGAITVDSTKPNASLKDKNETQPDINKKVKNASDEWVEVTDANIGQNVQFKVESVTANWYTPIDGSEQKQVKEYIVGEDFDSNNFDFVSIDSIQIVKGTDVIDTINAEGKTFPLTIAWATSSGEAPNLTWTSNYPNGSVIRVIYTAKLVDASTIDVGNENANLRGNENTASLDWNYTDGNPHFDDDHDHLEDKAVVDTYALALLKVNKDGTPLADATFQFPFYVKETADTDGAYIYAGTTAGTGLTNTITTPADGKITVKGVKSDEYSITETAAPAGYNLLGSPITVTPVKMSTTTTVTSTDRAWKIDQDGNVYDMTVNTDGKTTKTVHYTNDQLAATAAIAVNLSGTVLPSTGGIGTTIFYIVGGLLVIGAAVILVARRKAHD